MTRPPLRWLVLAAGLAGALWFLKGYYEWTRDKSMTETVSHAMRIAVSQFSPAFESFVQAHHRAPRDNAELGLAPPLDASWAPFHRVELYGNGDLHFEFAVADAITDAQLVWRIRPRDFIGDQPVICGARGVPATPLEWNGLHCDFQVEPPDPAQLPIRLEPPAQLPQRPVVAADAVLAAVDHDDEATLAGLKEKGEDVCAPTPEGQSPLAAAVRGRQTRALAALLTAGCDPRQIEPFSGRTSLMIAANARDIELTRQLLAGGDDPRTLNAAGDNAWFLLGLESDPASQGIRTMLRVKGEQLDVRDHDGATLLMRAAAAGKLPLVDWLIGQGAQLNLQDPDGHTALMQAALAPGAENVLQLLASRGARLDLRDTQGRTALMLAREIRDPARRDRVVRALLLLGAPA